jgi:predicted amidophosphoribosyltransferase
MTWNLREGRGEVAPDTMLVDDIYTSGTTGSKTRVAWLTLKRA